MRGKIVSCGLLSVLLLLACEKRGREQREPAATSTPGKKERKLSEAAMVESRQIAFAGQTSLYLKLEYVSGELDFQADTSGALVDLRFEFEREEDRPEIIYDSTSTLPALKIRSARRDHENISFNDLRGTCWRIKVSPRVVLDFQLEAGAMEGSLDFTSLKLDNLMLEVGAGELDLAFEKPNSERPRISINAGAAATTARGLCNANFKAFEFHGGAGKSDLTFDGDYAGDGHVELKYGVGLNTVFLPRNLGAKIRKSGSFLAPMSVHGFDKEGDLYYSKNYEQASGRLDFDIEMGVGHTTVKWLD